MNTPPLTRLILIFLSFIIFSTGFAQEAVDNTSAPNWQLLDFQQDSVYGVSINRAFRELLKGKTSHPVIVAVIDNGLDTAQEDLQGHIWRNKNEIPGNGKDDDQNGYIDDIFGWNFRGGKDGREMENPGLEEVREYFRLRTKYDTIKNVSRLDSSSRKEYDYWLTIRDGFKKQDSTLRYLRVYVMDLIAQSTKLDGIIRSTTKKDTLYYSDILNARLTDSVTISFQKMLLESYTKGNIPRDVSFEVWIAQGYDFLKDNQKKLDDLNTNPWLERKQVVGDDPENIQDRNYGNNNVSAGDPDHGTVVSGIISAIKNNGKG